MAERSRLVALDHEVSDPGKRIGHHRPEQRIPGMANGKSHNQRKQPQQGACGVHGAIARVAVLLQIEGEEIFVAGKFLFGNGLSFLPGAYSWGRRVRRILLRLEDKLVLAGGGERRAGNAQTTLAVFGRLLGPRSRCAGKQPAARADTLRMPA